MMRWITLLLTMLAAWQSLPVLAAEVQPSEKVPILKEDDVRIVEKNLSLSEKSLDDESIACLEKNARSGTYAVAASAAIVLSRHDAEKYREGVQKAFAVDDYAQRSEGKYNIIPYEEVVDALTKIVVGNQAVQDTRVPHLLAFQHFRNQNKWFLMRGQRISAARFFRGSFLSGVLGAQEAVQVAGQIDARTRQKHEEKPPPKPGKDAGR